MTKLVPSAPRKVWMAILAKASPASLEKCFASLNSVPNYHFLRSPEIGLTMVRGRMEGTGQPFNLGEMTLTRCVVQIAGSAGEAIAGFGYVAGRSQRHAELAALCDALLQHQDWHETVYSQVIEPLRQAARDRHSQQEAQVEATRVNFFTMPRGEG
ncbi:phosphonate C-P lyase system protein PhnG [Oscillatoria sp. CS-180]|uniref:phosphonate C-P lyase system protein PhnG n=1 Tax=Oscillatoria sp. CS-180 TaxID=3021720 RepID=UPI00232EBB56|nr:phosphonate C-P lyase system protein PhnG [Oscillatoria sp. CS-180]MDB9529042.1 phosphonate C-P lyase system protein PhnG [Oscillatoria sp. CS-180]